VVGYLQSLTDKVDIDLATVAAYDVGGGSQVLVPQRIEPARRVRELSDTQVNDRQAGIESAGSADFRAAIADAPAGRRDLLEHLADWADTLERDGLKLTSYRGKRGIVTLLPPWPPTMLGWCPSTATSRPPTCSSGAGCSRAARHAPFHPSNKHSEPN
jgi:hypothetical protein